MKAIVYREKNIIPNIEDITLDQNNIELSMSTASFNHRDLWIVKGLYPGVKAGSIMGSDGIGYHNGNRYIVAPGIEWGSNEDFQGPNFRVLGVPDHGTFCEQMNLEESRLFSVPSHLSDEEAACLPVGGITAYRALFKRCNVKAGDNVLITGIGGGVALLAAQFAQAIGANVYFTTSSQEKIDKAMSLGFKAGFNYKSESWDKELLEASGGIDIVIDSASGDGFSSLIRLCNYGGKIAFFGGTQGTINNIIPQQVFWKQISILGTTMGSDADFAAMLDLVDKYKIKPVIHEILSFENYTKAFEYMKEGSQFGKIVLKIS